MIVNSYDEIPYPSLVYTDTHPGKLATLALLFGLKPASIANCRVLELGCGDGTNLIAIAQTLPQAQFWGIDASIQQVKAGQNLANSIGLTNITLQQFDLVEIDESLGTFDYIIAHGLYSWIPQAQQNILLQVCQRHLAPHGIVYISYNIYPGWHMEQVVRDMMKYHVQQLPEVSFEVYMKQAKGILQFIAHLRQQGNSAFDILLQEKSQQFQLASDNYLYHDFLAVENHPVYFEQFIHQIQQHQFAYVTDIEFRHYLMHSFPQQVIDALEELFQDDFLKKEQYMDFFYNRTLRRSLLCHQPIPVQREIHWESVTECYIAATLQPQNPTTHSATTSEPEFFKTVDNESCSVKHPITKAAIYYLTEQYPHRIQFEQLFQHCYQQPTHFSQDSSLLQKMLAQELLHLYCLKAVELHIDPPAFVTTISTYPTASPLARQLASRGQQPIINLRCELIKLDNLATILLPHLNGQKDKPALLAILKNLVKQRKIKLAKETDLKSILNNTLFHLATNALLVA